jgi:hypothetical protein
MRFLVFAITFCYLFPSDSYYYPANYDESRDNFKKTMMMLKNKLSPDMAEISLRVPSQFQKPLSIDGFYMPQRGPSKERLLIITSGVHGVEAYTGAAIQMDFLNNYFDPKWLERMGVLVIHAVNPYGYHYNRRVTENNVDLNRNLSARAQDFQSRIPDYEDFDPFINPQQSLSMSLWQDFKLLIRSLYRLATLGRKKMVQTSIGGQYQNPQGIYYGGQQPEDNTELIRQIFSNIGRPYSKILHIDLHTGYGERGTLHFFVNPEITELQGFREIFSGFPIDKGSDEDFYEITGSFDGLTLDVFKGKEKVIPMTFEFGTLDSQTIMGGFMSLRNSIMENQGHHHGYANKQSEEAIKKDFLEMFNPSAKDWRDKVMKEGTETLRLVTERFSSF